MSETDRPNGLVAMYSTTEKMKSRYLNSRAMQKIIESAFGMIRERLPESLSPDVVQAARVIPFMMPSKTFIFRRIRYCCAMRVSIEV